MLISPIFFSLFMLLALAGCSEPPATGLATPRLVRVHAVSLAPMSSQSLYSGEIRARHESRLGFKVAGKVVERRVEIGDHVMPGQVLMRLDPQDAVLSETSALAQADSARMRLRQSEVDLRRHLQLHRDGFISRAALDQYTLAQETATAELRATQAQLSLTRNQRRYTDLLADRAGIITAIEVEAGQVISAGQVVIHLAADGEREVLVSVPEGRVDELRLARSVSVSTWVNPGRSLAARLRELAPDADRATRTYAARVSIDAQDPALRLGMTASVHVSGADQVVAATLPLAALQEKSGQTFVWVVTPHTSLLAARPVRVGEVRQDSVRIEAGLHSGDVVVSAGAHLLQAGEKVAPMTADASRTGS